MSARPSEASQRKAAGWPRTLTECDGLKVELKREIRTGLVVMPAGTRGVLDVYQTGWHLLGFTGDGCERCGCKPRASRMSWRDFRLLDEDPPA